LVTGRLVILFISGEVERWVGRGGDREKQPHRSWGRSDEADASAADIVGGGEVDGGELEHPSGVSTGF
jgi:hypothetical protein